MRSSVAFRTVNTNKANTVLLYLGQLRNYPNSNLLTSSMLKLKSEYLYISQE
jgi:hypothetical protein